MERGFHNEQKAVDHSGVFDMWRDYMQLGTLMEKLRTECRRGEIVVSQRCDPVVKKQPHESCVYSGGASSSSSASAISDCSDSAFCGFCKQNGETAEVYRSHRLKDKDNKVICPVLRNYVCPTCQSTGDKAHTRRYCPKRNKSNAMF